VAYAGDFFVCGSGGGGSSFAVRNNDIKNIIIRVAAVIILVIRIIRITRIKIVIIAIRIRIMSANVAIIYFSDLHFKEFLVLGGYVGRLIYMCSCELHLLNNLA
jgi:hypothetical protein